MNLALRHSNTGNCTINGPIISNNGHNHVHLVECSFDEGAHMVAMHNIFFNADSPESLNILLEKLSIHDLNAWR